MGLDNILGSKALEMCQTQKGKKVIMPTDFRSDVTFWKDFYHMFHSYKARHQIPKFAKKSMDAEIVREVMRFGRQYFVEELVMKYARSSNKITSKGILKEVSQHIKTYWTDPAVER